MKKLSIGKLRLLSEEVLQRSQLATIYGGSGGDGCCVYYREREGNSYSGKNCDESITYQQARGWYHMGSGPGDGTYVSGYCCASC